MWENNPARREAILEKAAVRVEAAPPSPTLPAVKARLAMMKGNEALLREAMSEIESGLIKEARIYALRARSRDEPFALAPLWGARD